MTGKHILFLLLTCRRLSRSRSCVAVGGLSLSATLQLARSLCVLLAGEEVGSVKRKGFSFTLSFLLFHGNNIIGPTWCDTGGGVTPPRFLFFLYCMQFPKYIATLLPESYPKYTYPTEPDSLILLGHKNKRERSKAGNC